MSWETFSAGLAEELAQLPASALVVIAEPGEPKQSRYTQFAQSTSTLSAYVVVNSFLDDLAQASPRGEEAIMDAGWHSPAPQEGHENWWFSLPWPASSRQYSTVADMVVRALRDGYGIQDVSHWRYRAWNETTGEAIDLPRLGLDREPE